MTRLKKTESRRARESLREMALALPGAFEDFPWGERVIKVNKKVFVFLGHEANEGFGISVKLPETGAVALQLPFVEPTGYGLGKSGWVSASLPEGEAVPVEMLRDWILESYRAVAPKKLAAQLDEAAAPAKKPAPKKRR
jgi:predicted DNA-binding protein (MmcQ/YjbR family)